MRGIAYNTRMNRLFDKSIVLACCIAAAMGLAVDAHLVAAFCLGVIATSLAEVAQGERTRRASETASYAYIIAAVFVPPFVPFAPLALYDIARRVRRERIWPALAIGAVFVCALVADLRGDAFTTRTLLLTAILSVAATLLSLRTAQLEREQQRMRRTRDELQERALALEARNRDLADRQDYEVELATLAERARIAREIHDNAGHQLTRASLQAEALRRGPRRRAWASPPISPTLNARLTRRSSLVRTSVHALNDNAVDLSVQLEHIVEGAHSDGGPQIELEVLAEHAPAIVANCFAAVLREALSNTMAPRLRPDRHRTMHGTSVVLPACRYRRWRGRGPSKRPRRCGGHGARLHARARRGAWRHLHRRPARRHRRLACVCHRSQTARR